MSSTDNGPNSSTWAPVTQGIEGFDSTDFDFSLPEFPPENTNRANPSPGQPAPDSHGIAPAPEPDRLTEVLTGRLRARAVRTMPIRRGPEARGLQPLYDNMPPEELERRRQHNIAQARENKRQQRERNNAAAKRSRERRVLLIEDQAREIQRLREENGALYRERDYWKQHFQANSTGYPGMSIPHSIAGTSVGIGSSVLDGISGTSPLGGGLSGGGLSGVGMPVGITNAVFPQTNRPNGVADNNTFIDPGPGIGTSGAGFSNGALDGIQSSAVTTSIDDLFDFDPNTDFGDFSFDLGSI